MAEGVAQGLLRLLAIHNPTRCIASTGDAHHEQPTAPPPSHLVDVAVGAIVTMVEQIRRQTAQ